MPILLSEILENQPVVITEIDVEKIPLKLIEMGCLPGNKAVLLQKAPFGDPYYYNINETKIAIRKELANAITVTVQ